VEAPTVFKELSLADQCARDMPEPYRFTPSYLLLTQAGAITMTHIDFSNTTVCYILLRGCKIFYFVRPTARNLKLYKAYLKLRHKRPNIVFETHAGLEGGSYKVVVTENQAIFIPPNFIHMVYTIADSVVIAFNILHRGTVFACCQAYAAERIAREEYLICYPNFIYLAVVVLTRAMTR
jgi:F-box/leucine-rich repeat protein 10/11